MKLVTLGLDPEFFLTDGGSSNLIPACGLIGGTKDKPLPIGANGLTIQEDGVAVEFGMNPVEHEYGSEKFMRYAYNGFIDVQKFIQKINPRYGLSLRTYWAFRPEQLTDKRAITFGCNPDFNAYQQGAPYTPLDSSDFPRERCTGGHIHVGYDKDSCPIPDYALVQLAEVFALYGRMTRQSAEYVGMGRNMMYGRPGAYRPKSYGFEYRTPSSLWLTEMDSMPAMIGSIVIWATNNPNEARLVYDQIPFMSIYEEVKSLKGSSTNLTILDNLWNRYIQPELNAHRKERKLEEAPVRAPRAQPRAARPNDLLVGRLGVAAQRTPARRLWDGDIGQGNIGNNIPLPPVWDQVEAMINIPRDR